MNTYLAWYASSGMTQYLCLPLLLLHWWTIIGADNNLEPKCGVGVGAVCIEFMLTQRWNWQFFLLAIDGIALSVQLNSYQLDYCCMPIYSWVSHGVVVPTGSADLLFDNLICSYCNAYCWKVIYVTSRSPILPMHITLLGTGVCFEWCQGDVVLEPLLAFSTLCLWAAYRLMGQYSWLEPECGVGHCIFILTQRWNWFYNRLYQLDGTVCCLWTTKLSVSYLACPIALDRWKMCIHGAQTFFFRDLPIFTWTGVCFEWTEAGLYLHLPLLLLRWCDNDVELHLFGARMWSWCWTLYFYAYQRWSWQFDNCCREMESNPPAA